MGTGLDGSDQELDRGNVDEGAQADGDPRVRRTLVATNIVLGLFAFILCAIMVFGLLVSAVAIYYARRSDPAEAFEGWTPAREWWEILPLSSRRWPQRSQ
jgi:hypothetical protein